MDDLDAGAASGAAGYLTPPDDSGLPTDSDQTPTDRPETKIERLLRWADLRRSPNLVFEIQEMEGGDGILNQMGERVMREFEIDETSRKQAGWDTMYDKALKLANQVADTKSTPWVGASNVVYPLVGQAAMQFASRAYPAIVAAPDVVKGVVIGFDGGVPMMGQDGQPQMDPKTGQPAWQIVPGAKKQRAERVGQHMSYQLLFDQPEWEEETARLCHVLPIVGCMFRKTYFDPVEGRNFAVLTTAKNLVINYWARSVETAPRLTEVLEYYPHEIREMEETDAFLAIEYGTNEGDNPDDYDSPREFLEQHRRWDLDGDGYTEPYVITVHKQTRKVVRVVARFDAVGVHFKKDRITKIDPVHYYQKYDFLPNPDGGIYGVGFGKLLGPLNESINTALNQMFDAATLQNTGGGFVGKGLSTAAGALRFKLGEWKLINSPGGDIRNAIVPLQFQGPSATLFQLLGLLIQAGKELGAHAEVLSGNQTRANQPAATTLALIEQGLKVYNAIYKGVYRSLKGEMEKLYRLNGLYLDDNAGYRRGDDWKEVSRKDYMAGAGVEPISDPSMTTEMQKLGLAELLRQFINDPYFEPLETRLRILKAANITKPEELLKKQAPTDPKMALKAAEIAVRMVSAKSKAMVDLATAIEAFSAAELNVAKAGGEHAKAFLGGLEHELEKTRLVVETMFQSADQAAAAAEGQGGQGAAA